MTFDELTERFSRVRVLVVGDAMVDREHYCHYQGAGGEHGGPVFREHKLLRYPGGAANVAMNLKALGAQVKLLAPIGQDEAGEWLKAKLAEERISWIPAWLACGKKWLHTTTKTRVYRDGDEPVCRIDRDAHNLLDPGTVRTVLEQESFDLVCLSDYQKGCFSVSPQGWISGLRLSRPKTVITANAKPALVGNLRSVDLLAVNDLEFRLIHRHGQSEPALLRALGIRALLHTEGDRGLGLVTDESDVHTSLPHHCCALDTVGAGDASFAGASLALAALGLDPHLVAEVANAAGAAKVSQKGTKPAHLHDLERLLRSRGLFLRMLVTPLVAPNANGTSEIKYEIWSDPGMMGTVTVPTAPVVTTGIVFGGSVVTREDQP